jgi:hypothetical protein
MFCLPRKRSGQLNATTKGDWICSAHELCK